MTKKLFLNIVLFQKIDSLMSIPKNRLAKMYACIQNVLFYLYTQCIAERINISQNTLMYA